MNPRLARDATRERERNDSDQRRRTAELEAEVGRLADAIAKVGHSAALAARLQQAEEALAGLTSAATGGKALPYPLHATAAAKAMANRLGDVLKGDPAEARGALRAAFGSIRLVPKGEEMVAEFEDAAERLALAVGGAKRNLVAGACNVNCIRVGRAR